MPVVTACHLEICTWIKHEYILRVEIMGGDTGPVIEVTELATLHIYMVTMSVEPTLKKIETLQYIFLSYTICQFSPLLSVKAYEHHTRFGHFGEEKNT